jgi:hypothetical protein
VPGQARPGDFRRKGETMTREDLVTGVQRCALGVDVGMDMLIHASLRYDPDVTEISDAVNVLAVNNVSWADVLRINS